MSLPRRLLRAVQRCVPPARGPGLTVLAYHLVEAGTDSAVDLPRDLFRHHLDELMEHAEVVGLRQGVARLTEDGEAPARPLVALTFDDAYRNFVTDAWPLLVERKLPATLFVPAGFVAGECPPPNRAAPGPAASWAELGDALGRGGGLEIGSHTWSHPDLTGLPEARVDRELVRSRDELRQRLGVPVTSFCYPRGLWSPRIERRVGRLYDVAAIGGGGRWRPGDDPLRVQRVSLRRDGPVSLRPLLRSRVWLEERVADRVRRWRS